MQVEPWTEHEIISLIRNFEDRYTSAEDGPYRALSTLPLFLIWFWLNKHASGKSREIYERMLAQVYMYGGIDKTFCK